MAENPKDAFSSALTLFSGIYQDMSPSDLPEGLSPDNQDQWPLPGSTGTRPALNKLLGAPFAGTPTILSVADFPAPTGDFWMMSLDSLGNQRWTPIIAAQIVSSVLPGVQCKSEAAFDKQWFAYFNAAQAEEFSDNIFVGVDAPRYIDGTSGSIYRVTSDAPGVPPAVTDDPYPTFNIAASPTGLVVNGIAINFQSLSVDGQVCTLHAPNGIALLGSAPAQVGDVIVIAGTTPSGYEGTFTLTAVSGNNGAGIPTTCQFNNLAAVGLAPATAGTFALPTLQITTTAPVPYTQPYPNLNVAGATNAAYDGQYQMRGLDVTKEIILCGIPASMYSLTASGGGTVQQQGMIVGGPRNAVVIFNINGALTAPSIPVTLNLGGGGRANITGVPLGPPGTTQRLIAFTQAYGATYFYLTPAIIPGIDGLPAVVSQGTVIDDNTSTSLVTDFSDVQLASGTNISAPGNNLFNQVVLSPCLGVIAYRGRLFWWGEINNIYNFAAGLGFESGYSGALASAIPKGWSTAGTSGGTAGLVAGLTGQGLAYKMTSASGVSDCLISQGAATDYYGAPILEPSASYLFRIAARASAAALAGNLVCDIYSPTTGVLATATIAANTMVTAGYSHLVAAFSAALPASIPVDTILRIYLNGVTNGAAIIIDEGLIIDAAEPVLNNQLRASYFANPFGYDVITGSVGLDTNDSVTACFKQRDYLYLLTQNRRFITQDNGTTEPDAWTISEQEEDCGCCGPCAIDETEGVAFWAGRYGRRVFVGGAQSKLVSLEVKKYWNQINWAAELTAWVTVDPVERIVHFGMPIGSTAGTPTADIPLSYRAVDAVYNVPDPIRQSFQGRMIALELCRKSTIWFRNLNCAAMVTRPLPADAGFGNASMFVLGGGNGEAPGSGVGYGNLYYLNFLKFTDDDYGVIGNGAGNYYFTYGYWGHEKEESRPELGSYRHIHTYQALYITGVGLVTITPYINDLEHPWLPVGATFSEALGYWVPNADTNPLPSYELSATIDHDLEWALNVIGNRVFYKIQVTPLAGQTDAAFTLEHMIVSGRMDNVFPVRGAVL